MKGLLFISTLALLSGSCSGDIRYTLEGHIEGLTGTVIMQDNATGDTLAMLPVTHGELRYKGHYDQQTSVTLLQDGEYVGMFFIEPGDIRIEGRLAPKDYYAKAKVEFYPSGTPANDAFGAHLRFSNRVLRKINLEEQAPEYRKLLFDSILTAAARNLAANTDNIFGVIQIPPVQESKNLSRREVDSIVGLFPAHLRNSRQMQKSRSETACVFRSEELSAITNFTANDTAGTPVTLSEVIKHNRYVLLDFWFASCMPCRWEMPHIRKSYETYHAKGFEVVGISVDKKPNVWKKAITEESMTWINLLDDNRRICGLYHVTMFPTNYLIDCSTGKIVARDLRGGALAETLGQLLK